MPNNFGLRDYNIVEMENEDNQEHKIDAVKAANNMQDRVVFGKPKVGKMIQKVIIAVIAVFALVMLAFVIFDIFPNLEVDAHYTLTFVTNGGTDITSYEYDETKVISLPEAPERDGYLFVDWYLDAEYLNKVTATFLRSLDDHGDLTFYARWVLDDLQISLIFNTNGGSLIDSQSFLVASDLNSIIPTKLNMFFAGWFLENNYQTLVTKVPYENATLYAMWSPVELVTVGHVNQSYIFPIGNTDYQTRTINGGFELAATETTYQLWHDVRVWAEDHDYVFANLGKEGNDGVIGALPTVDSLEPVTNVSYLDAVVWLNALSEMNELDPIYRDAERGIVKDSGIFMNETSLLVFANFNGYRLPSIYEWEMAARWTNDTGESDYSKMIGGRYWTKGNYLSGAKDNHIQSLVSFAWYTYNSQNNTHRVATKNANDLGLYDMSGHVSEWCNYTDPYRLNSNKPIRGGSYSSLYTDIQTSDYEFVPYTTATNDIGFRIAIGNVNS